MGAAVERKFISVSSDGERSAVRDPSEIYLLPAVDSGKETGDQD